MELIDHVSKCGLYCANCGKYQKGKCPGCSKYDKATWCKIRTCCIEKNYATCAECTDKTPRTCKNYNNIIAKFFEIVFKSDRKTSIEYIKENGCEEYICLMKEKNQMVIKKQKKIS